MAGKAWRVLVPAALTLLAVGTWNDITRYLKIKRLDMGSGHPEMVPAEGRKAYPRRPCDGTPDGTGEFDSAQRGGPVHIP